MAHAGVVALHMLCCGLPALLALTGAAAMTGLVAGGALGALHRFLHSYEFAVLAVSAGLVGLGGWLEWRQRAQVKGPPALFLVSVGCFIANATLIVGHQIAG